MKAIMTVTGIDHTGIIAAVATAIAEQNINIHNVQQSIMDNFFTMILHVVLPEGLDIATVQEKMADVENQEKLVIRIQSEEFFTAVNEI
ncbi:ACT domain-containing protein [Corynebacterium sp. A21]|uniref:ACT domain-containing protein n=1 Tax=Corynebacterium sp. A21 TaxID=3457318 RepID=UPI003FD2440A